MERFKDTVKMDTMIGQTVDNYKIIEILGRGGMGVVFKAMDLNLEKIVALKMIDPFLARNDNFMKRFRTEAKALARLENSNIVNVYALRETDFGLFMVMEYVQAKTVSEWMREKGLFTVKETLNITKQILNAIGHAHKVGVIHRDIKPNNILLGEDGIVKVMDFGLAKVIQESGSQNTVTQTAAGTLYYMSPEQIKGLGNVDNRSDIYSIGMTVYEMIAGKTPFEKSESEFTIQKQIIEGKIPPPTKYSPSISKQLNKFIMKAIDKDPDKRYQDISLMMADLQQLESKETESEEEKTRILTNTVPVIDSNKGFGNKKIIYIASACLAVILVLVYIFFLAGGKKETTSAVNTQQINAEKTGNKVPGTAQTSSLALARLAVTSNPSGAEVFINNIKAGKTPLVRDSLSINGYAIAIKKSGFEDWSSSNFNVKAGNNNIDVNLTPVAVKANAYLNLNVVPSGNIFVDNSRIASNTSEVIRSSVAAGKHTVKFVSSLYGSKETTVDLDKKQVKSLTCYFRQQVNIQSLNTAGVAFWGSIYINGKNTGKTTPGDTLLAPGTYSISVKKTGYTTVEKDVVLNVSPTFELKTHSLVFHLK